jgi:hypothetical protein
MNRELKPAAIQEAECDRVRFVMVFDEAKTLVDCNYYNSFRWIFDNVIPRAWEYGTSAYAKKKPLPFMAIFLGTNSQVADFIPPPDNSSYRYFIRSTSVPRPFTALAWDAHIQKPLPSSFKSRGRSLRSTSTRLQYNCLPTMDWLCRFGRPVWYARWRSVFDAAKDARGQEKEEILLLVQEKLCHIQRGSVDEFRQCMVEYAQNNDFPFKNGNGRNEEGKVRTIEDMIQASSAILAVLVGLDFDFSCPSRAAEMVASRLRWAVASNESLTRFLTTYPSEPVLAEAASQLFFNPIIDGSKPVYTGVLKMVLREIEQGNYDFGSDGELTARIICKHSSFTSSLTRRFDGTAQFTPIASPRSGQPFSHFRKPPSDNGQPVPSIVIHTRAVSIHCRKSALETPGSVLYQLQSFY